MPTNTVSSTFIMGVKVNIFKSMGDVMLIIKELLLDDKSRYICTVNPEFILKAQTNADFKSILNNSAVSTCDGIGILYASNYSKLLHKYGGSPKNIVRNLALGIAAPMTLTSDTGIRVTGVDLFYAICAYAEEAGLSVFLLGGRPKNYFGKTLNNGVDLAALSAAKLKKKYPKLRIIGASSVFSHKEHDDTATLNYMHTSMDTAGVSHIDFCFVAYGAVNQENWIVRNMAKIPAKLSVGIGGTFDFVSEYVPRSPKIFIKLNLEWLFRLIVQPWRIRRIFQSFIKFPLKVFITSLDNQ